MKVLRKRGDGARSGLVLGFTRRPGCVGWAALSRSIARVAELADAVDSKSTDESLVGSTPTPGTNFNMRIHSDLRIAHCPGFVKR